MSWYEYLLPYDFSPLTVLVFLTVLWGYLYALGALPREARPGIIRVSTFLLGLALCYAVMQTQFDYYSQYMFFVHRGQHLVLHHLGPMLIALSNPLPVMRYWGSRIPAAAQPYLAPLGWLYRIVQQPFIAAFLFVGLIYFWLWPSIHFDAMLSRQLYWVMNWSMLLDGLLFWWLIFDPRSPYSSQALAYGKRILFLVLIIVPQQLLGAWIVFSRGMVYDVYEVCGRAWPMAPETDQLIGGILTWIPPSMMSGVAVLIILGRLLHDDGSVARSSSVLESQSANP